MLLKSVVFVKNCLTGLGSCPAPGIGLALQKTSDSNVSKFYE